MIRRASSILKALSPRAWHRRARHRLPGGRRRPPAVPPASAASAACGAPWLQRDAAERHPGRGDRAAVQPQRRRGGDDREGVGGALPDFQVAGVAGEPGGLRRQAHGGDQFPRLEHGLASAACRRAGSGTLRAAPSRGPPRPRSRRRVEGGERDAEIGRVGGDALLGPAKDGVEAVLAAERVAAGAGFALVAGAGRVVEIRAAGALQEVAAVVAALRNWAEAPDSNASATAGKRRAKAGSWARSALRTSAPIRAPPSGVCSMRSSPGRRVTSTSRAGRAIAALHQVEQVGAAARYAAPGTRRPRRRPRSQRADVVEPVHAASFRSAFGHAGAGRPAPPR